MPEPETQINDTDRGPSDTPHDERTGTPELTGTPGETSSPSQGSGTSPTTRPTIPPKKKTVRQFVVCHHCEQKLFLEGSSKYVHCTDCEKFYRVKSRDN